MKQVTQNLRDGAIRVEEVPAPALRGPGVLVATACSLISPGTERAALELGRSTILGKALRRPDQVRKVLDNLRREGFWSTLHKVQQRLDVTRALGYSASGIVLESRDSAFNPGDRVACAGTDAATHAEINFVPRNLCAVIPANVGFEEASFAALGAIAVHAVHLAEPALGDSAAVIGLGPVGLLTLQALTAAGCHTFGFDPREDRLQLARDLGADRAAPPEPPALEGLLRSWRIPAGFDRVFITAASSSSRPVEFAVAAARDRARIVVVGDVRADFPRNECYAKELSVVFARSYGPGRYDPVYEEQGVDYPRAYVPWTAGRNLEAFLDLLSRGQVQAAPLISHRFPIAEADRAYELLAGTESSLGVLLQYPLAESKPPSTMQLKSLPVRASGAVRIGCIGAGQHASGTLFPLLKASRNVELVSVAATRGLSAKKAAAQFGFARCTTDAMEVIRDPEIDAVFIATRHNTHAELVIAALEAGKAVFVEKPLCLSDEELDRILDARDTNAREVFVGFNRRYASATRALAEFFSRPLGADAAGSSLSPVAIRYAIHAGPLPSGHWLHDPAEGGRIRGEVCHFVDWCCYFAAAPLRSVFASLQGAAPDESLHAQLNFDDGSVAAIVYDTSAHSSLPKESIEVSSAGRTATLENFSRATFLDSRGRRRAAYRGKGQAEMLAVFFESAASGCPLDATSSSAASTRATLKLIESASTGLPVWFS